MMPLMQREFFDLSNCFTTDPAFRTENDCIDLAKLYCVRVLCNGREYTQVIQCLTGVNGFVRHRQNQLRACPATVHITEDVVRGTVQVILKDKIR